jgi:trans-aconitate methyltransferase
MDRLTLAAYDKDAAAFAKDWHEQPAPRDLQAIVARFFVKGGISADIGCGSGREVAWLNANGFPADGFDASEGLLAQARSRSRSEFRMGGVASFARRRGQCLRQCAVRNLDHASRPRPDRAVGAPHA